MPRCASDPANQQVFEFEVRLAFFPSPVELHCCINADAEFVGGYEFEGSGGCGGGGGGGGGAEGGGECSSPPAGSKWEGEIRSTALEGGIGYIAKASKPSVGLDLRPLGISGPLFELACGETHISITGSVIAPMTSVNKMSSKLALKLKESKGRQAPERFEGASQDILLTWAQSGKRAEQAGLTATELLRLGEPIEIGA